MSLEPEDLKLRTGGDNIKRSIFASRYTVPALQTAIFTLICTLFATYSNVQSRRHEKEHQEEHEEVQQQISALQLQIQRSCAVLTEQQGEKDKPVKPVKPKKASKKPPPKTVKQKTVIAAHAPVAAPKLPPVSRNTYKYNEGPPKIDRYGEYRIISTLPYARVKDDNLPTVDFFPRESAIIQCYELESGYYSGDPTENSLCFVIISNVSKERDIKSAHTVAYFYAGSRGGWQQVGEPLTKHTGSDEWFVSLRL